MELKEHEKVERNEDEWAAFADLLVELIQSHAAELNIESWPDPEVILRFQELKELYKAFVERSKENREKKRLTELLDMPPHMLYSLYIRALQKKEDHSDDHQ